MKIPLTFSKGHLYFKMFVKVKNRCSAVEFHIDTGSSVTFLNVCDAHRLRISAQNFPFKRHVQIGGGSLALHELGEVTVTCRDEIGGSVRLIDCQPLPVAVSLRRGEQDTQTAQSMPTIIGTDFLLQNKLALYFNPSENVAYLERNN